MSHSNECTVPRRVVYSLYHSNAGLDPAQFADLIVRDPVQFYLMKSYSLIEVEGNVSLDLEASGVGYLCCCEYVARKGTHHSDKTYMCLTPLAIMDSNDLTSTHVTNLWSTESRHSVVSNYFKGYFSRIPFLLISWGILCLDSGRFIVYKIIVFCVHHKFRIFLACLVNSESVNLNITETLVHLYSFNGISFGVKCFCLTFGFVEFPCFAVQGPKPSPTFASSEDKHMISDMWDFIERRSGKSIECNRLLSSDFCAFQARNSCEFCSFHLGYRDQLLEPPDIRIHVQSFVACLLR